MGPASSAPGRRAPLTGAPAPRLAGALFAYGLVLAVFLLLPPTLHGDVGAVPGFTWQELFDLLTPVAALVAAWIVVREAGGLGPLGIAAFVAIGAVWADAHGLHLAANAIGDTFPAGSQRDAFYATDAGALDHFLDEDAGHWLWHGAWAALELLLLGVAVMRRDRGAAVAAGSAAAAVITIAGSLVHGFTFFLVTTEGGTAALGIALSAVILAVGGRETSRGSRHPIVVFLAVSALSTLALYAIWAALNGGRLVEPCSLMHC